MAEMTPEWAADIESEFADILKQSGKVLRRDPELHFSVAMNAMAAGVATTLTALGYDEPPAGFEEKFREVLEAVTDLLSDTGHAIRTAEIYRLYLMAVEETAILEKRARLSAEFRAEWAAKGYKLEPDVKEGG